MLFVDKEEEVTARLPFDSMGYAAVLEFRLVIDEEAALQLSVRWIRGRVRVGVVACGQWTWRGHSDTSLLLKRNWPGDSLVVRSDITSEPLGGVLEAVWDGRFINKGDTE